MENSVGCYVVGLLDSECLLGLVFILIGVSLMRQTQDCVPYASSLSCSSFPLPHICPNCVIHLPVLWRSLSYQAVEGNGDLLASKRPPLACIRGPYVL